MKKHTTLKSKFNSAFSLVELLVVIAVIAVIAAIAIPNISGTVAGANASKFAANAAMLVSQYNSYATEMELTGQTATLTDPITVDAALTILNANDGAGTTVNGKTFGLGGLDVANVNTNLIGVTGRTFFLIQQ
jgi:type IV pilus assembly protein PilA